MVALARVQKPRPEIVILYLQIIGKLPVPSLTAVLVTVTRLAWEIQHMVINAQSLALEWKSVPTSYHLQGIKRFAFKHRNATRRMAAQLAVLITWILKQPILSVLDAEMEKWKWKAKTWTANISILLVNKMERKCQDILYVIAHHIICVDAQQQVWGDRTLVWNLEPNYSHSNWKICLSQKILLGSFLHSCKNFRGA